jgi:hypothetical protein
MYKLYTILLIPILVKDLKIYTNKAIATTTTTTTTTTTSYVIAI